MWYNMEEPKKKIKCLQLLYIICRYRFYQKYMDIDYVESFSQKKKKKLCSIFGSKCLLLTMFII